MEESAMFESDNYDVYKKRRKKNWSDPEEMEAFLNLWEENCRELSCLKRNFSLFYEMSHKMASQGFRREPRELRKKLSNVISKFKAEAEHSTNWAYFNRVHHILAKMKQYSSMKKQDKESFSEKMKNEMQKILLITPNSNGCIDEADMETILKAMNGEDITSKNEDASCSMDITNTENRSPESDHAECEDYEKKCNDITSEASNQTTEKPAATGAVSMNQCTTSTPVLKKKTDDQEVLPKILNVSSIAKKPVQKTQESKACNSKKDEVDLYAELLATKLRSMDNKSRHIAMNKIDNILFKMKMEQFEGQQRSQNITTPQKSNSLNPSPKE